MLESHVRSLGRGILTVGGRLTALVHQLGGGCCSDDRYGRVFGDDFKRVALQRAHFNHLVEVLLQTGKIEALNIAAGEVEATGPFKVNLRGGGGSQSLVPQLDELLAAAVALARVGEDLVGLEVEEAQAHGAMSHDAFEVPLAAAAAVVLLGIESDDGVSPLPWALGVREAAEADAVADGPD